MSRTPSVSLPESVARWRATARRTGPAAAGLVEEGARIARSLELAAVTGRGELPPGNGARR